MEGFFSFTAFFSALATFSSFASTVSGVFFSFSAIAFLLQKLFGFLVESMLAAEAAILVQFKTIRIVLLVLHRVVIALLAFAAGESDLNSHVSAPP